MKATDLVLGAGLALCLVLPRTASAEVLETTANGFAARETIHLNATPDQVYDALVHPAAWWNPDHTYSGSAANLTLDARAGGCLCESLPHGGSALLLTVVFAEPGSVLRFRGPMGPFQGQGVDSALTFTLKAEPGGTLLTLDNNVGGYMKGGFDKWSGIADGMLNDLATRLAQYSGIGNKRTP